ncbi:MAG TPA: hypothetical protein VMF63_09505 [Opitutaceae bacterium]|nr:hypothetical protein [Opitutaceae bacterium]
MTSEVKFAALALAGLLLAAGVQPPAARIPAGGAEPASAAEIGAALLGGCRALAADGLWLETYRAWARRDLAATPALIRLTTHVDDRPLYFWLNGARMLAYDLTQWRLDAAGESGSVPAAVRQRIASEQAGVALDYLREARRRHPRSAEIWIEMAAIHLNLRADPAAAADCCRAAASLPGAPHFAARLQAELLRRLGRPAEAYACLCALHPTLPPGDAAAMPGVVLARIRALEATLGVPAERRYRAQGPQD